MNVGLKVCDPSKNEVFVGAAGRFSAFTGLLVTLTHRASP